MTDEVQNEIDLQSQNESTEVNTAPEVVETSPTVEETIPKSRVNELIHQRTREVSMTAYEKGKREAALEFERRMASQAQPQNNEPALAGLAPETVSQLEERLINRMAERDRAERERQYFEMVGNQWVSKVDAGKTKYSDFDEKIASLELGTMLPIVELSNLVDNTADVIYDLAQPGNEHKIANLLGLLEKNPRLAERAMYNLSDSIKKNQSLPTQSHVKEPLSKVSASTVGLDNGSMSIRDYQNQDWLRG